MPTSRPIDPTNLKEVRGIGAKVEARLNEAGILDLNQLARIPANELAAILAGLPGKFDEDRIAREDWLTQAAKKAADSAGQPEKVQTAAPVRHNFTVEVRRAVVGGQIESSKVVHIQTKDEQAWGDWDPNGLIAFIEERSGMLPAGEPGRANADAESAARPKAVERGGPNSIARPHLHTFALVPGSGPDIAVRGPVKATLVFGPAAIRLPANQAAEVRTEVFVEQRPPSRSILVGQARTPVRAAHPVRLEISCELPVRCPPTAMFAAVRVLATTAEPAQPPARGLADACLKISA